MPDPGPAASRAVHPPAAARPGGRERGPADRGRGQPFPWPTGGRSRSTRTRGSRGSSTCTPGWPRARRLRLPRPRRHRRPRRGRPGHEPGPALAAGAPGPVGQLAVLDGGGHRLCQLPQRGLRPLAGVRDPAAVRLLRRVRAGDGDRWSGREAAADKRQVFDDVRPGIPHPTLEFRIADSCTRSTRRSSRPACAGPSSRSAWTRSHADGALPRCPARAAAGRPVAGLPLRPGRPASSTPSPGRCSRRQPSWTTSSPTCGAAWSRRATGRRSPTLVAEHAAHRFVGPAPAASVRRRRGASTDVVDLLVEETAQFQGGSG